MRALIVIDVQNDFLPGGALGVLKGDKIIPIANSLMENFELVVASQDWHPADHLSFASNHPGKNPGDIIDLNGIQQVLWPDHCVQNTRGAEFSAHLNMPNIHKIFQKGTDIHVDSYSAFFDNNKEKDTGLHDFLKEKGVDEVCIVGLATDYCVKFTALDAIELGYKTIVISDATKAVNLKENDFENALVEMQSKGVGIRTSQELE